MDFQWVKAYTAAGSGTLTSCLFLESMQTTVACAPALMGVIYTPQEQTAHILAYKRTFLL